MTLVRRRIETKRRRIDCKEVCHVVEGLKNGGVITCRLESGKNCGGRMADER